MTVHFADLTDLDCLDELVNDRTRVIYLESPTNPNLVITDLAALSEKVRSMNEGRERPVLTVIDNTFASPFCQRPLEFGMDIVVHSLTKHIGGFGTVMGGAVVARKERGVELGAVMQLRKDMGGSLSPSNAWNILVYGLSTLTLRMRAEQDTAWKVAEFLENHPKIYKVMYPGLESHPQHEIALRQMTCYRGIFAPGSMIYFLLSGRTPETQKERGMAMANHLAEKAYTVTLAVSLGQIRTLIDHPAGMTHLVVPEEVRTAQGIDPGGIRMSVGIEPAEDIIGDLERALAAVPD
jgi:cystathionine beta-lyase/cystathionine gamma-synthase